MSQSVTLIDYGSGNLRSAAKAVERAAREAGCAMQVNVSGDVRDVRAADRLILPGVGAFGQCAAALRAIEGMTDALDRHVQQARPFLGICVGMQLLATSGTEHGSHVGLGWIPGRVEPVRPADPALKIPHMGWNTLDFAGRMHPALAGLVQPGTPAYAYFVHSYQLHADDPAHVLATTPYGGAVTAIVGQGTILGTQFHPEKSQQLGLALLRGFLTWTP